MMQLEAVEAHGQILLEGSPDQTLLLDRNDTDRLLEACFSAGAHAVLLYAANMTAAFFDLSSGEAGSILQKLRLYHIRLGLICPPGSAVMSSRFRELLLDERPGRDFAIFETREAALQWLLQG